MGKASRKKRQKELQAKSTLKDKPLKSSKTSPKWSVFNKPLHILLITIVGILAYSNTFNVPFQFDDANNIIENYKIKGISNFWPPSGSRWFGFLTFALNYKLGGLNTFGYHIVNLIIHIINAILIYFLVVLTFKTPYFKVSVISASVSNQPNQFNLSTFKPLNYLPLFIALLFISHPIQTQAVTYIVQRFTSLATMFYLLSLVMYIKWRLSYLRTTNYELQTRRLKPAATRYTLYAVSLISAILAMKTKEIAFTLPFIIILYEFCFFSKLPDSDPESSSGRTMKLRRFLYLMPFLLTLLIIPLSIVGIDKPIGDAIGELREAAQETEEIPRWDYLFTQFRVIITYIRLLFLPINQNLDYDHPIYNSFLSPNVFLSFLFLLSIFGLGVYLFYRSRFKVYGSLTCHPEPKAKGLGDSSATPQTCPERKACPEHERRNEILPLNQVQGQNDRKRRNDIKSPTRLIAFGIFWFFITLSVESSIIPIEDVIFEHRVYLPSVGAIVAFGTAVFRVFHRATEQQSNRAVVKGKTAVLLHYCSAALIIIALSIATYQRNIVWKDEMNLWEDVVKKSPNKARGHNEVGVAYKDKGWFDKAIEHYQIALRLKPDLPEVHNNLGIAYSNKEWFDTAIEHYQIALRLKPDFQIAHNNIGNAYAAKGWIDKAIEHYWFALRLKPDFIEVHNNLGVAYEKKGLLEEAIKEYQTALMIDPEFKMARDNLNKLLRIKGK